MRLSSISVLAVGLSTLSASSTAAVQVLNASSSSYNPLTGVLSITASSNTVTVRTDNAMDMIAIAAIEVTAASGTIQLNVEDGDGKILTVGAISQVGGAGILWVTNVTHGGTLGSVTATYIQNLKPTGNITGAITATGNNGGSPNPVSIASIAPINGNLTGNVSAQSQINSILLANGNIGTPGGAGITISSTSGDINEVEANAINAAITAGTGKAFRRLKTNVGKFEGSLTAYSLSPIGSDIGIDVNTDLDANITLSQPITGSATVPSIRAGGTFVSGRTISLPSNGIAGQIVFNNAIGGGAWNGTVSVGGSSPFSSPPYYTNKPYEIGGGSVGLASFRFHGQGCVPENGSSYNMKHISKISLMAEPQCLDRQVTPYAAHYGPIKKGSVAYTVGNLYTVTGTSSWDFSSSSAVANGRRLEIGAPTGGWQVGTYSFDLNFDGQQARLVSDQVTNNSSANSVPDYTYTFELFSSCDQAWKEYYELNGDGLLTMGDAVQWFATPVDFNNNGSIDAGDVAMQLNAISTIGDE